MDMLVTGATGNVGREVVAQALAAGHRVQAGSRLGTCEAAPGAIPVRVDFEAGIMPPREVDAVFLMRPPQLTDPELFARVLDRFDRRTRIVFLSVEGAGRDSFLPHAKIEARIEAMGFDAHVFVRPSYFMENLLTTLWPEIAKNRRIYLPAGGLELDWVSARDVAAVSLAALTGEIAAPVVDVCSGSTMGFAEVCTRITAVTGVPVRYEPAGLPGFVRNERARGTDWSFIAVLLLLHTLPRFRHPPPRDCAATRAALGREPETLDTFLNRNVTRFRQLAAPLS